MKDTTKEYVKTVIKDAFDKVPQETHPNQMLVGEVGSKCFYKMHNHRLYFDFNRESFLYKTNVKGVGYIKHKFVERSKEHIFMHDDFTVWVKKSQIGFINKKLCKRWHIIDISTNSQKQIKKIVKEYYLASIKILKKFIKIYGGSSNFKLLNFHEEDKVKGEDAIDYLPLKMKFHNQIAKKVYNERSVEFSSPVLAANYISNRAIENIAPKITKRLTEIENHIENQQLLINIKSRITSIKDVVKLKSKILLLSPEEKNNLSDFIFNKFEVAI